MSTQTHRKQVLVTGGTGFIGAYIIRNLVAEGYSIRALRRSSDLPSFVDKSIFENVEWLNADIFDLPALDEAMAGCDAVVHCAAKVSFREGEKSKIFKTNVEGTANMVNVALENNIPRFIHLSSVGAIGRTTEPRTVNENDKWQLNKTHTSYSLSKYQAEIEVWRGIAEGLKAVIVNPSVVLGYGNWHSSSSAIFKNVYEEFPWYTTGVNGFVDVEDVAKIVTLLLNSDIHSERFILNGDNWQYRELFNTIADSFGKKRPSMHATPLLGKIAWRLEKLKALLTGSDPLLTRETARVARSETRFDNSKILKALPGFNFTPIETTIANACKAYLELHGRKID